MTIFLRSWMVLCCFVLVTAWGSGSVAGETVTLAWDPIAVGSPPVASYRIYRQLAMCPVRRLVPQSALKVQAVDSEETASENKRALFALDGNLTTFWHSRWTPAPPAPLPHTLVLDLGSFYYVDEVQYVPRQDGNVNGTMTRYEVAVSETATDWEAPVARGTLPGTPAEKQIPVPPTLGRYVRLVALAEQNTGAWTSAAEVRIMGTPVVQVPVPKIGEVSGTATQFADTTVPAGSVACWYVTAASATGQESLPSNAVQWPLVPGVAPTNFRLVLP